MGADSGRFLTDFGCVVAGQKAISHIFAAVITSLDGSQV